MARRRKGRRIDGWLVVDKPVGPSSAAVVNACRRALGAQKAGHSGTLDPLASGVLAIAFGEATKTVPIAQDGPKTYRFTVRLGTATTTDDAEGAVLETRQSRPDDAAIAAALARFEGETLQVPPAFSAVKVAGQRAFALAREAVATGRSALPELAPRPLVVSAIALVERPSADEAVVEMTCGTGGYVRAVARDLGAALGCLGHVSVLRRLATGPFTLADVPRPEFTLTPEPERRVSVVGLGPDLLLPVAAGLRGLAEIVVDEQAAADLRLGRAVPAPAGRAGSGGQAWASHAGEPVAILHVDGGLLRPARVFERRCEPQPEL